jgi:hypothetical protein
VPHDLSDDGNAEPEVPHDLSDDNNAEPEVPELGCMDRRDMEQGILYYETFF